MPKRASRRLVDAFFAAAQSAADVTAECGNYDMWQRGVPDASGHD